MVQRYVVRYKGKVEIVKKSLQKSNQYVRPKMHLFRLN